MRRLRLGEVLRLRKEVVHPHDKPRGRAVFVGLEHLESGSGLRTGALDVDLEHLTGRKPKFYKGDMVYGYLRPYLNKVWIAEFDGLCSVDQYVYEVDGSLADAEFVAWFIRSPHYLARAPVQTGPGQLPRIRLEEVAAIEVDLPDLDQQRLLVSAIRAQMAEVARARSAAEFQLDAVRALSSARSSEVFHTSEVTRWPRKRLGDLASNDDAFADGPFGSHLKTAHYSERGARVIRLQNIGRGTFLGEDKVYIPIEHYWTLERHSARQDDVVVAALGDGERPAGRACLVPPDLGPALVKADCFRIRLPGHVLAPGYLAAYLNSPDSLGRMAGAMRGATRPRVTLSIIREVEIPLPPVVEQVHMTRKLNEELAEAGQLLQRLEQELVTIESLPEALLRRAFAGEL
ncbi:MAG: hypothetical protein DME04_22430 [Candidatus Rokuibacteriota bacterium]|nr:MAG: hypothetical protein DME04_22430 [Candidatus Rokubacteria bacterium]